MALEHLLGPTSECLNQVFEMLLYSDVALDLIPAAMIRHIISHMGEEALRGVVKPGSAMVAVLSICGN